MVFVTRCLSRLAQAWSVLLLGSLVLLVALPARAQAPEGTEQPGEEAAGQGGAAAEQVQTSAYQRHLDNGVRLFKDQNYRAAITEFEAAYRAEPKASPLVNIALSHKALHDYPSAIEALARAIEQHPDTLKPEHLDAAKREVTQLRQLLAYVTVRVHPTGATLFIDGQRQPAEAIGKPIALGPGPHQLTARLEGHEPAEQQLTLTSGQGGHDVTLVLTSLGGQVQVVVRERDTWVQVDSQPPIRGGWQGTLPPGVHYVSAFKHGREQRRTLQILVGSGKRHVVIQNEDGQLESAAAAPTDPADVVEDDGEPRQGFYFTGHAALLGIVETHPVGFTKSDQPAGGAGIGARIGFRVADWAAFEGLGQLTSVGATGDITPLEEPGFTYEDTEYNLQSLRLGGGFRVLLPGRSWVRFVGVGSAGLVVERLRWETGDRKVTGTGAVATPSSREPFSDSSGIDAFGQLELGVEFEVSNVLLGLLVRNMVQSTSGLDADRGGNPWEDAPLWLAGLSAHVGYGIW
jgi:hypothetical protein